MKTHLVLTAIGLLAATVLPLAAQNGKPDPEGFIRDWLVLAPFPIAENEGAAAIDLKQFPEEASPAAKDGATQTVEGKKLTWKKIAAKDFYIDFKELNPDSSEQVAGWAVAYVVAAEEKSGLTLKMNSNDQGKAFLNGKEVVKNTEPRTLEKEAEDSAKDVKLKKGVNVVVLKVVNETNNWQGSLRFVDAAGKPVTDVKIETKP
jgi:hypothetical protein